VSPPARRCSELGHASNVSGFSGLSYVNGSAGGENGGTGKQIPSSWHNKNYGGDE